jgi:hypothetical protein
MSWMRHVVGIGKMRCKYKKCHCDPETIWGNLKENIKTDLL